MKISKATQRDSKRSKRKNGMQVDNKGIFLLEEQKVKRANKNKGEK
jgi:hypothetical protein